MKVAISAMDASLDGEVEGRFGRSPFFVLVEPETMQFETFENPNMNAPSGAGIGTAQWICEMGAKVVITGRIGPKARQVLMAAGVHMVTGVSGKIREAVEKFKTERLPGEAQQGTDHVTAENAGMRRSMGGGAGRGMGRGKGCGGRGMGMRSAQSGGGAVGPLNSRKAQPWPDGERELEGQDELAALKGRANMLADELQKIQQRIQRMEKD